MARRGASVSKRKTVAAAQPDPYPLVIETYSVPWDLKRGHSINHPSCFNGDVSITRYRITVERIDDPPEVLHERLRGLWRHTDNWHHRDPLRQAALRHGLELDSDDFGADVRKTKEIP